MEYLTGGNMDPVKIYRYLYILAISFGPYMTVSAVWTVADIFNGLMAIPNLIALVALNKVMAQDTAVYVMKLKRSRRIRKLAKRRIYNES